ncbi:MAG: ATP-binding cassette domain-containing protein [Verrucomicrobiota bacterium]|nr:ATP-binding cassette domain-containing protein [Verrucomicrobiota bacterium]
MSRPFKIQLLNVKHSYDRNNNAIHSLNISAQAGEMICIMGPSGSGKSTLIRILAGHLEPSGGDILLNNHSLYDNLVSIRSNISYIPEEDSSDQLLTVYENLSFSSTIRCPHLKNSERKKKLESLLTEIDLYAHSNKLVGNERDKNLSGGERKRLNTAMDLISDANAYLFDEPTSGLSSKDSENILRLIRKTCEEKISFISIHQPSARLFHLFDKALLLDKEGRAAFYGSPREMMQYFKDTQQYLLNLYQKENANDNASTLNNDITSPESIFDVLDFSERANDKLPENFWEERFIKHQQLILNDTKNETRDGQPTITKTHQGHKKHFAHFKTHLSRAFLSKIRNKGSLITTLLVAPILALLISGVLRHSEKEIYEFGSASHIPAYIFITLVVAMFLGLTNSSDEIIRDKQLLRRERNHSSSIWQYILAKFLVSSAFAFFQCFIFLSIGNAILSINDMLWIYLAWTLTTCLVGSSLGLLISSIVKSTKTALNIIPLALIPQIILGGALIRYEEMNFNYSIFTSKAGNKQSSKLQVPFICNFIPLRWSYESLIIAQDTLNPLAKTIAEIEHQKELLLTKGTLTKKEKNQLNQYKDAHTIAFGITGKNPTDIKIKIQQIGNELVSSKFDVDKYYSDNDQDTLSSIDVYQNGKVRDLMTKAEIDMLDYRIHEGNSQHKDINVFFGKSKYFLGKQISTLQINTLVIFIFILTTLCYLRIILRKQSLEVGTN